MGAVVFCCDSMSRRRVDPAYIAEAEAARAAGLAVETISYEALVDEGDADDATRTVASREAPVNAIYRGWMLTPDGYGALAAIIEQVGGVCFTSPDEYVGTHYLPNWYAIAAEYTPETAFFDTDADLVAALRQLGWDRYFVKDYVKSLKTSVGSIIEQPEQIEAVVSEMEKYRGFIEGGICIRRVEDFVAGTERRYFVLNGKPYGAERGASIPAPVGYSAGAIRSPFFSVDVAVRADGIDRIVEVGDGQVSDLVGWSVDRFVEIWRDAV